ncbi:MAG: hypothetical protein WC044_11240 [Crocinitomicaceae bacterium]
MKKIFIVLFLFMKNFCFSQNDSLPSLLIHYSDDPSIVLTGYKQPNLNSESIITSDLEISLDTLIKYYSIRLDFFPDTTYLNSIKNHLYLDSIRFSALIIKAELRMWVIKSRNGGPRNYEDLSLKYGVIYYAGSCMNEPSDFEKEYDLFMRKLLLLRNGTNWEEKYNLEYQKRN